MGSGRATLLVLIGVSATAASAVLARDMVITPNGGAVISDSPKEVMDQAWQIVFRDYLDTTGKYNADQWRKLGIDVNLVTMDDAAETAAQRAFKFDNHVRLQSYSFDTGRAIQVFNTNVVLPGGGYFTRNSSGYLFA